MNMKRNLVSQKLRSRMRGGLVWCAPAVVLGAALLLASHAGWFSNSAYAQDAAAPAQGGGGRGGRGGGITATDIPPGCRPSGSWREK